MVKDIRPGPEGTVAVPLGVVGGSILFTVDDGVHGAEMWRSDGTEQGTALVQDIAPGAAGADPKDGAIAGSRLFFVANDGIHGDELWSGRGAILTHQPRRALSDLRDEVTALRLPGGIERSLTAKLDAAGNALDGRGAKQAASRNLEGFIQEVGVQRGKKISAAAADDLAEFARETLALLVDAGAASLERARESPLGSTRRLVLETSPNPFGATTSIRFELPRTAPVTLVIYSVAGERVALLRRGEILPTGHHLTIWDGRDDSGRPVASGVFFARARLGRVLLTRRLVLVK